MAPPDEFGGELEALEAVTRRLSSADTEQDVCDTVLEALPRLFDTDVGGIWFSDTDARALELTAATDRATDRFDVAGTLDADVDAPYVWQAFESAKTRTRALVDAQSPWDDPEERLAAELVAPLGAYGVLVVATTEPEAFGDRTVHVARILATGIESALSRTAREHELRIKNDRLEEVIGIVSHDLRNPLEVSKGYLGLVREDVDDARLEHVAEGLDRIEALVSDLLTLSEQGRFVETRSTVDLDAVATEAWTNVYTPEATLRVVDSIELFGDSNRLLHVFENLFRNAIEHGGDDVTVRVGVIQSIHASTRVDSADHVTGFFVADDGPGIPEDEQAEIFEAGWSTEGTGLGLTIVKRVVEAHGWQLSVKNGVGGGTRFEVVSGTKPVAPFGHS